MLRPAILKDPVTITHPEPYCEMIATSELFTHSHLRWGNYFFIANLHRALNQNTTGSQEEETSPPCAYEKYLHILYMYARGGGCSVENK